MKDFYTQLYTILLPLALNPYIEKKVSNAIHATTEKELLIKGFDFMFFKRRQVLLLLFSDI